jgi:hypothetical protein
MTHVGIIVGCDVRTPQGYRRKVRFRETKTMWISECRMRFSKRNLRGFGNWPLYKLESEPTLIEE